MDYAKAITSETLREVHPNLPKEDADQIAPIFRAAFRKYGIAGRREIAAFMANVGWESQGFTRKSENMNYSAERLMEVFGRKKFPPEVARRYAHKPMQIANRAYANKGGNRGERSGDGWKFRGGGFMQTTLYDNYLALARAIGMTVDEAAEYVRTPVGAVVSACVYWMQNRIGPVAEADRFTDAVGMINRAKLDLEKRRALYRKWLRIIDRVGDLV